MISCGRRRILGLLIGTIFLNPLLGASVSAGAGVLSGAHPDIGINDNFWRDNKAGNFRALFVLVRKATPDKVLDGLKQFNGRVMKT